MSRPLIIAHRGASQLAPENTMTAFEKAIAQKADGIELDVWKCKSGQIVVTHNCQTKILTGKEGNVEKMSLKELQKLDFGMHKGAEFRGEKIPLLRDVLDLCKELPIINIEIKGTKLKSNGIELDVAEMIIRSKLLRHALVSSFNPAILLRLQALNPAIRLGLLLYEKSPLALRRGWSAKLLKPYSLHPSNVLLKKKMVERAHKKKSKVIVWTVNNTQQLEACMLAKVDAMITDDPQWMHDALCQYL